MKKTSTYPFLNRLPLYWLLGLALSVLFYGCANRGTPTGGPRDERPPHLLGTNPLDQSTRINGRIITFYFDEWIQVKSLKQNLQITPLLKDNDYKYKVKRNVLTLEFEKDFEANTTYTFEFGEAIQDITERNIAQNIRLAFSTGDFIDSLQVRGRVSELMTNLPVEGAVVSLYLANDTFNIEEDKPMYFTRADSAGLYNLRNIKAGEYEIYALFEPKHNLIYQGKDELIGFRTESLNINKDYDSINFPLVYYDLDSMEIGRARARKQFFEVKTNKVFAEYDVKFDSSHYDTLVYHQQKGETILFYHKHQVETDSIDATLVVRDSIGNEAKQAIKIKFNAVRKAEETPFSMTEVPKGGTLFTPDEAVKVEFYFSKPVIRTTFDSISYLVDKDTVAKVFDTTRFVWNQSKTHLKIEQELVFDSLFKMDLKKMAFLSVENDSSAAQKIEYPVKEAENYGTISGTVSGKYSHFTLQLLSPKHELLQEIKNERNFKFEYVTAGHKLFRILIDEDQDGHWEKGDFKSRQLPEKVLFYEGSIEVRANWDFEDVQIVLE